MAPGARSRFGAPIFETEVFRKQMRCIEESICDILGTFRRSTQSFSTPIVIRRPGNCDPLTPLVTPLRCMHWWHAKLISCTNHDSIFGFSFLSMKSTILLQYFRVQPSYAVSKLSLLIHCNSNPWLITHARRKIRKPISSSCYKNPGARLKKFVGLLYSFSHVWLVFSASRVQIHSTLLTGGEKLKMQELYVLLNLHSWKLRRIAG